MRVAILGASGLIGSALQQVMTFEEVYAYDHETLDVTQYKELQDMVREVKPHFLFNCAGIADPEECDSKPALAMLTNAHPLGYLSSTCNETGTRIVQFSPESVFSNCLGIGHYEYSDPNPHGVLGKSKAEAEKLVSRPVCGGRHYIIRSSHVFGQGRCFVNYVLEQARQGKEVLAQSNSYITVAYAPDLARAVYRLIREAAFPGIYHLVNGGVVSYYKLAEEVLTLTGYDLKLVRNPNKSHHVVLQSHKVEPLRPFRQALQEYLVGLGEVAPKAYHRYVEAA